MTAGISGWSVTHGDLGGFTMIELGHPVAKGIDFHRDSELMQRWLEAGTFLFSMFRSHPGLLPDSSAQVWDSDLVAHTRKFTGLYRDLAPYRRFLQAEYRRSGLPPVRHGALLYPEDDTWFDNTHPWWQVVDHCAHGTDVGMQQFFLGADLLVAPVLAPGDTTRKVYFPGGRWKHWWSGKTFDADAGVLLSIVDAPVGQPPVFHRVGSPWEKLFSELAARYTNGTKVVFV
jgi:alpha-glucosidase